VLWQPVRRQPVCRLPVHLRLSVSRMPVRRLPVRRLPVRRLPVCRLPMRRLPVRQNTEMLVKNQKIVEEGDPHLNVYGAVFSTTNMTDFDVLVNQFRAIEIENPFQRQNDLPFTSLVTLDMRNWSPCRIDNIAKKKKVQSVLVNHKPKVSTFMKKK
jgi:hypothetical protein